MIPVYWCSLQRTKAFNTEWRTHGHPSGQRSTGSVQPLLGWSILSPLLLLSITSVCECKDNIPSPTASEDIFPLRENSFTGRRTWSSKVKCGLEQNLRLCSGEHQMSKLSYFYVMGQSWSVHSHRPPSAHSRDKAIIPTKSNFPSPTPLGRAWSYLHCCHWERVAAFVSRFQTLPGSDETKGSEVTAAFAHFSSTELKGAL